MAKIKRNIIKIDEEKCNGCGICVTSCAEGALKVINGKAKLISEIYCDGLGACLKECPMGALIIEEKEAEGFNEDAVGHHLAHDAGKKHEGCPSARAMSWQNKSGSMLGQWPIQLMLLNPQATYFQNADLIVTADCVPFAYADFHQDFLKGKTLAIGCPKLDDVNYYKENLTSLFKNSNIKSVEVVHMEVPCCFGLKALVESAIAESGKNIPYKSTVIGIKGEKHG